MLSCEPKLTLGTCVHPVMPASETAAPALPAPCAEMVSLLVGKTNGGGRVGIVVEPVTAKRLVMRFALQLFRRQPRPKVFCREANREKWLKLVLSVTPRGPWLVMTMVTIW